MAEVLRSVETFSFAAEEAKRIHGETIPMDASAFGEKPHRLLPAHADGCGGRDHALQLPAEPGGSQGGAGARRGQHDGPEARPRDGAHRREARRGARGRRPAEGRPEHRPWRRPHRGRGAGPRSDPGQAVVHRQPAGRRAHHGRCGLEARDARARQQLRARSSSPTPSSTRPSRAASRRHSPTPARSASACSASTSTSRSQRSSSPAS